MKLFEEQDRFNYPLTAESLVMDVGCHEGNFAGIIEDRYGCRIEAYEPVPEFFNRCVRRFHGNGKVRIWPFALGDSDRTATFGVKGDMSGAFCTSPNTFETVPVRDIVGVLESLGWPQVALLKLNCEGGEFEILERLLDRELIRRFDNISVQFHTVVPEYQKRHALIVARLSFSHDFVYDAPFCWSGWRLKQ